MQSGISIGFRIIPESLFSKDASAVISFLLAAFKVRDVGVYTQIITGQIILYRSVFRIRDNGIRCLLRIVLMPGQKR